MLFASVGNRRQSHRQWVSVPVIMRKGGSRIDGLSINISEGGIYLFSASSLPLGTRIEVEFRLPGSKELIRTCGRVRRRAVYLYGIEFLSDAAATGERTTVQAEMLQDGV